LEADQLPVLLGLHESESVGTGTVNRNAAIAELQGNCNAFIDPPEWAGSK
jgi:endonuclease I